MPVLIVPPNGSTLYDIPQENSDTVLLQCRFLVSRENMTFDIYTTVVFKLNSIKHRIRIFSMYNMYMYTIVYSNIHLNTVTTSRAVPSSMGVVWASVPYGVCADDDDAAGATVGGSGKVVGGKVSRPSKFPGSYFKLQFP